MKNTFALLFLTFFSTIAIAQETTPQSQIRVFGGGFSPIEWPTDYVYSGGGIGISAALSKSWVLNGDMGWYGREIRSGAGYVDRNIYELKGSVDYYFSRAFRGFFLGANMGYTHVNSELKEGASSIGGPEGYIPIGIQLGFNAALTSKLDMNIKSSWSSTPGGPGGINFGIGLGYNL